MMILYRTAAILFVALASLAPLVTLASAQELALKRVLLSYGGVGYFEHEAQVDGDATLALDVPLGQVDDILKSIVVFDDRGGAGTVRLPGREPLGQAFDELAITPDALDSAPALLAHLKGTPIVVTGKRSLSGRVLSVDPEIVTLPNDLGTTTRHRVSLMTESGVQQFLLEEQDTVGLADPALDAAVNAALEGFARHRARDRRTLQIEARGSGTRTVRVGYVVGAPLWKSSYRLGLGGGQGTLQGWAHLENLSGLDWNSVGLTLTSGNPVTFRQAIYAAYFVDRPEVPVEVLGRVLPPPDDGAVAVLQADASPKAKQYVREEAESMKLASLDRTLGAAAATPAPAPAPPEMAGGAVATSREDAATQIVLKITEPVTLAAGQSMTLPVIDASVSSETVALYQPRIQARHPLASVRLVNDTGSGLPPGVITIYDRGTGGVTYAGDARLAPMPAGETRLLNFAVDQALTVDREERADRTLVGGKIAHGNLQLALRQIDETVYRIKSAASEPRKLIIEQPRRPGWDLAGDRAKAELTENAYRIPLSIAPGASTEMRVVLERTLNERYVLGDLDTDTLIFYANAGALDPALREALGQLAAQRGEIDGLRRKISFLENSKARLFEDQERLRSNLREVPAESDLHTRYLAKLSTQEDAIEKLMLETDATRDALVAAEATYADAIKALDL